MKFLIINSLKYHKQAGGVVQYTSNIHNGLLKNNRDVISIPEGRPTFLKGEKYIGGRRIIFDIIAPIFYKKIFTDSDIILYTNYIVPMFLNKYVESKIIVVVHDIQHKYYPENFSTVKKIWLNWSLGRLKNFRGLVVFISKSTRDDYIKFYGEPIRHCVVYNPIDVHKYIGVGVGKCDNRYLICASHFYPHKNFSACLKIFEELVRCGYGGMLYVTGHGFDVNEFEISNDIKSKIIKLGFLSRDDLVDKMKNADALISMSNFEGFNMPVAEAAILGVKCILSDISVHNELYADIGFIVRKNTKTQDILKYINNESRNVWRFFDDCEYSNVSDKLIEKYYDNKFQ